MSDLQQQLADLRARVARIQHDTRVPPRNFPVPRHLSRPFDDQPSAEDAAPPDTSPDSTHDTTPDTTTLESALSAEIVETALGRHLETEKLYEAHRRHGSADIGALSDLPHDLLSTLSNGAIPNAPPSEWAFLDTETTGLSGGTGTCAFLVGVGRITPEGFRVRQFFMRDYAEEASSLDALARHLAPFRVLVTYNGRTFDQPLLETRYRLNRTRPPFAQMEHLDLLYGARRLWKLRFESCRLVDLENQILGVERQGDVPGSLIPYIYFEYLRSQQLARLLPVFHHNSIDILSLACLTAIVPHAFNDPFTPANTTLHHGTLRHGTEMAGIARWLRQTGELDQARTLFRRAIDSGLPDELLFRTLWDVAQLDRKLGADEAALAIWEDLAAARNPLRVRALEELAKHHEHRAKDHAKALECTRAARAFEDSPELERREARLKKRLSTAESSVKARALL